MITPHRIPFFLPWIYPSLTWRIPTDKQELFLTFDDGPIPGPTEFVLEELKKANVKATFFCIGDNVRKYPFIFKRIINEGHVIGNHTFNHLSGWKTNTENYIHNILLFEETVKSVIPEMPIKLFRPPYGRITFKQAKLLKHYKIIMWDVLSVDYNKKMSAEACLKNTINAVRPGSIIVFHDSVKAEKNMTYVLPRLIDHFMNKHYSFKPIH
jgi:peptidoglycan/xylan/chitin deacetylase (PgdA/CDA1 family)